MKIKIDTASCRLQSTIDAQTEPNREEAIVAVKAFWDSSESERLNNKKRGESLSYIRWVFGDPQENDFKQLKNNAAKDSDRHLYARNVIRYGIANNCLDFKNPDVLSLIDYLLDDTRRPKKRGNVKLVGSINETGQIGMIINILRYCGAGNIPMYSLATTSISPNNAFDIVASATGLSFDTVRERWRAHEKESKNFKL